MVYKHIEHGSPRWKRIDDFYMDAGFEAFNTMLFRPCTLTREQMERLVSNGVDVKGWLRYKKVI